MTFTCNSLKAIDMVFGAAGTIATPSLMEGQTVIDADIVRKLFGLTCKVMENELKYIPLCWKLGYHRTSRNGHKWIKWYLSGVGLLLILVRIKLDKKPTRKLLKVQQMLLRMMIERHELFNGYGLERCRKDGEEYDLPEPESIDDEN